MKISDSVRSDAFLLNLFISAVAIISVFFNVSASTRDDLERIFRNPDDHHRAMIIWQWMDGLVTRDGITRDLEAFREAGLSGIMNFQIGGPQQIRISDSKNAIGSDNWKDLLHFTLDECERLGLTFGTHNCPGWSSSAYPEVQPKYSMQKLVATEIPAEKEKRKYILPRPDVNPQWNYYEDVAVFLLPSDSVVNLKDIYDISEYFDPSSATLSLPKSVNQEGSSRIVRIGQTTNGKTNEAQAPQSGRGLECDKLNAEAVDAYWNTYPRMVIETAGRHVGKSFAFFEIDSYEAGGQTWSPALPEEFRRRAGYELRPWLPYMAGVVKMVENEKTTARFLRDWENVVKDCVAENYYGRMTRLAREAGLGMMIEPYGTGHQKPFGIIDFERIANASEGAEIATEFWQDPARWGWKDMGRHEKSMRKMRRPLFFAESFTCWPLKAWQDSPATIKPLCDRAFCHGVNRMMLHAGAANPWPTAEPGMSFGIWGTHFVPRQTWWKAGGAKALFDYMARCQALLQFGLPAEVQPEAQSRQRAYHRTDGETDIFFVCNPTDSTSTESIRVEARGRNMEIWNPYDLTMGRIETADSIDIRLEPYGSRFLIVTPCESDIPSMAEKAFLSQTNLLGNWTISFPGVGTVSTDSLQSWHLNENPDIRYFSGTAAYRMSFHLKKNELPKAGERCVIALGDVKDMARMRVNGVEMPLMWKAPFECDVTEALKAGVNDLEIEVTNEWANRMIGDEQEPDDLEWSEPLVYDYAPGKPVAGRYLTSNPEWLRTGTERPSKGRQTAVCFKFFGKDSPLLPSGLLGPVSVTRCAMQSSK